MGVTKTQNYTEEQNALARFGKAFSHPARVAIILHLLETQSCVNGHLVEELGLAQATVSQHLKELKETGIIKGTVEGSSMNYCINAEVWEVVKQKFVNMFNSFDNPGNCC